MVVLSPDPTGQKTAPISGNVAFMFNLFRAPGPGRRPDPLWLHVTRSAVQ
jgi:hypothetical protein